MPTHLNYNNSLIQSTNYNVLSILSLWDSMSWRSSESVSMLKLLLALSIVF